MQNQLSDPQMGIENMGVFLYKNQKRMQLFFFDKERKYVIKNSMTNTYYSMEQKKQVEITVPPFHITFEAFKGQ